MMNLIVSLSILILVGKAFSEATYKRPFSCVKHGVCVDAENKTFACGVEDVECFRDVSGVVKLHYVPRGSGPCDGDGVYLMQTEECVSDGKGGNRVQRKKETILCPGTNKYHNNKTQVCCTSESGRTEIHLKAKISKQKINTHECCGTEYIDNSTYGCCAEQKYDKGEDTCTNGKIVKLEQSEKPKSRSHKSRRKGCSNKQMERRFRVHRKRPSFVYGFQVSKILKVTDNSTFYKVKSPKQIIGIGKKMKTIESELKVVILPRSGCPSSYSIGDMYVVLTQQKIERKKLTLNGRKDYSLRIDKSDAFTRVLGL